MKIRFLVPILLLASCRPASQGSVIPEDKLQSVYIALLEEGDRYKGTPPDTSIHFNSDSVFHAFDTSEKEFRSAIAAYQSNPERWQKFFEGVMKKLDEKEKKQSENSKK